MKTNILLAAGVLLAGGLTSHASVLTFDNPDTFGEHFTGNVGSFDYNATKGGLFFGTSVTRYATLGNSTYNPGPILDETVSITFSQGNFGTNPSMGLVVRASDDPAYATKTGIVGLVGINSAGAVRLRIGQGTSYAGMSFNYDVVTSGLALTTDMKFDFSILHRNVMVGGVEQVEVRLIFSNAVTDVVYADSQWQTFAGFENYTEDGDVGLRVYAGPVGTGFADYTLYDFSPAPAPIPEPSSYALFGGALLAGGWMLRRQKAVRV